MWVCLETFLVASLEEEAVLAGGGWRQGCYKAQDSPTAKNFPVQKVDSAENPTLDPGQGAYICLFISALVAIQSGIIQSGWISETPQARESLTEMHGDVD